MSQALSEIMHRQRDDLIETVAQRLHKSTATHYRSLDTDLLRSRSERLVDTFLTSLAGAPGNFGRYIREITEERISEGFFLEEIQTALNILEERAWQIAVRDTAEAGAADLSRNLSLITGTIGAAKDQLALVYLEHKERAESRAARLEAKLQELFKGTDAPPLLEDDT
jgi:hypothetical protein